MLSVSEEAVQIIWQPQNYTDKPQNIFEWHFKG